MHNGMGTIDELKTLKQPLLLASTTQAARRDGNVIVHVANGTSHIGPAKDYPQDYSYLADVLQGVLPDVTGITISTRDLEQAGGQLCD